MQATGASKGGYRFGLFHLDHEWRKLSRQGLPVKLSGQPLQILRLLLERPGKIITREELRQSLWPDGTYVEFDASLNAALKRLRFALGDSADNPIFIETVPKQGYRFIAGIQCDSPAEVNAPALPALGTPRSETGRAQSFSITRWGSVSWWLVGSSLVLLLLMGWRFIWAPPRQLASQKVIAVLPFSNEGAGAELNYLRYAIASELVTDLSHVRSLTVRPFASTSRYVAQSADPVVVGKELRVSHILTGGYILEGSNLLIQLELVDVALNKPVWRDEIVTSPLHLITLRNQLSARTAQGLLPVLNVQTGASGQMPPPGNERGFNLYLHSVSVSHDPKPNLVAVQNLEESVSLDAGYAPAWDELCRRYYIDYEYGNGGVVSRGKAVSACRSAAELDPNGTETVAPILAEEGDLLAAYDDAAALLRRRPDSALAHYTVSYVLRYAGLLEEASKECDAALVIDPGSWSLRSCATTYTLLGDFRRARKFIALDENTGFGKALSMEVDIRTGDTKSALADSISASQAGGVQYADVVRACLGPSPRADLSRAEAELDADPRLRDPEGLYRYAAVLSYCGELDAALRQLSKAIQGNYCSYPAMDTDPLFSGIRRRPEFGELRQSGIRCQQNFLAHRRQVPSSADVLGPADPSHP